MVLTVEASGRMPMFGRAPLTPTMQGAQEIKNRGGSRAALAGTAQSRSSGTDGLFTNHHLEENMGRTVMPFSHVLETEHGRWKEFRKSLSKEDQEALRSPFRPGQIPYLGRGLHGPSMAIGNHSPLHLPGTRKNARGYPGKAQGKGKKLTG